MKQVLPEIGEGERIIGEGELGVTLLADIEQLGAVEVRSAPYCDAGPPLHAHAQHAEAFFVMDGELTFRLEGSEHRVGPETWVFVPPEVVHTFAVTGKERARFLDLHVPSCGFGDVVRGLHAARNQDELRAVRAAFDQHPAPEYSSADPGLVVFRRAGAGSGVGSTEPPKSAGAGFAGAGAGSGVGSTEPPKSAGAGFAGAGAGSGVGSTEPPKSAGAGFAGAGAGKRGETITDRPGRRATLLVDADELTVSEFFYGPGERGAQPHVHHHHADAFIVVEGEFTFTFRDGSLTVSAGTFLLMPPGVVHGFDNDSSADARCFNLHMPSSGFGDYLRGRNPDFDQHDPPADGGADPTSTIATRLSG